MNLAQRLRLLWVGARGILRRRDITTVVICPTVELPAEVGLDLDHHIESCSRLPELQGCGQSCMPQVRFSSEDLNDFATCYEGKKCALCAAVISRDDWYKSRLAVLEVKTGVRETPGIVRPSLFSTDVNGDPICSRCYGLKIRIGKSGPRAKVGSPSPGPSARYSV